VCAFVKKYRRDFLRYPPRGIVQSVIIPPARAYTVPSGLNAQNGGENPDF
jgi:hypothetical protein